jgi:FG-GAP repeat
VTLRRVQARRFVPALAVLAVCGWVVPLLSVAQAGAVAGLSSAAAQMAGPSCTTGEAEVGSLDDDFAPDIAVGLPWQGSQSVDVHYTGLAAMHYAGSQFTGVDDSADFGFSSSSIDLNGDGCSELVVGAPHLYGAAPADDLGSVTVLAGSPAGVTPDGVLTVLHSSTPGDGFGASVATATRGSQLSQGPVDLWVGAPDRPVDGQADAGAVDHYVFDSSGHATLLQTITAATAGVGAPVRAGAHFGQVLSANSDSVLIGAPGDTVAGHPGAGSVQLVTIADGTGLLATSHFWTQASTGVPGSPETGDNFGFAVWDNGSTAVVGVPGEGIGSLASAGMVQLFRATTTDFATAAFWKDLTQDSPGIPGVVEAGDRFGASVAMGKKLFCDWTNDLAIGSPGEAVGSVAGAGSVTLVDLSPAGFVGPGQPTCPARLLTQGNGGLGGVIERWDHVGQSLSIERAEDTPDFEDPADTLLVGVPYEDVGNTVNAGIVTAYSFSGPLRSYGYSGGSLTNLRYGDVLVQPGGGFMALT